MAMHSQFAKRKRNEDSDEDESDYHDYIARSKHIMKREKSRHPILPEDTSLWTPEVLVDLQISWHPTMIKSPSDLLRLYGDPFIKSFDGKMDLDELAKYVEEKLNFNIHLDNVSNLRADEYKTKTRDAYESIDKLLNELESSPYPERFCRLKAEATCYSIEFLQKLRMILMQWNQRITVRKDQYVTLLESFCKICRFFGERNAVKRMAIVAATSVVVSIPDLLFVKIDRENLQKKLLSSLCVAEVKGTNYTPASLYYEKHNTRLKTKSKLDSGSSKQEESPWTTDDEAQLCPSNLEGSSQHVGQLLVEVVTKNSIKDDISLGLMLWKTKVMMTCLKVDSMEYVMHFTDSKLTANDKGVVHYTKMYDLLIADDRSELMKALIRLGFHQNPLL